MAPLIDVSKVVLMRGKELEFGEGCKAEAWARRRLFPVIGDSFLQKLHNSLFHIWHARSALRTRYSVVPLGPEKTRLLAGLPSPPEAHHRATQELVLTIQLLSDHQQQAS
jgi:hypothetical protein